MADLSEVGAVERIPVRIEVPAHWSDHHFQGRPVLPAVEAMQLLSSWTRSRRPTTESYLIRQAAFDKFLELPAPGGRIEAFCDLADLPGGALQASLVTRGQAGTAAITRTKVHARMVFQPAPPPETGIPLDAAAALSGPCRKVAPASLYQALVPFGPAYRNISQALQVARAGALALIKAPDLVDPQTERPLGSPFVADAAFHAACVWSQRYAGIVAFPVGIDERRVLAPTRPGETYACRVFPSSGAQGLLAFDIWILDLEGRVREMLTGVRMRDVSGGRLRPPEWIRDDGPAPGAADTRGCRAWTLIERDSLMPFAERCLSEREKRRLAGMGLKRRNAYLAGRLACKQLARSVFALDGRTAAHTIETLAQDGLRSAMAPAGSGRPFFCSLAHDRRFSLAAAAQDPIGVDIESADERALKGLALFASPDEQTRVHASEMGALAAALRLWTVKEAVAKAMDITMAEAWQRTEVNRIGVRESLLCLDGGTPARAIHQDIEGHVATWVVLTAQQERGSCLVGRAQDAV